MMRFKPVKLAAVVVAAATIAFAGWVEWARPGLFRRVEWMTYDWRVRLAFNSSAPVATNLGAVFIDDESLRVVNQKLRVSWPWPRDLWGSVVTELAAQGAQRIAFDVLFGELHGDDGGDGAFARRLREAGNVYLPAFGQTMGGRWEAVPPADLFRTNCLAIGHATSDSDADGVLRRARPFKEDAQLGRLWHLGILLAADHLGLDLKRAEIHPDRIDLQGAGGVQRSIPLDEDGYFLIDWALAWNDPRLTKAAYEDVVLAPDSARSTNAPRPWAGKLVVIGSIGSGNNVSDIGATPLAKASYLVSKHWNVANSLLTGRFIHRSGTGGNLVLILALGALSAVLTWNARASLATLAVLLVAALYVALAAWLFVQQRLWLPIVVPVGLGLILTHVASLTYRLVFEERERRRVRGIFAKLVSPEVVSELLAADNLHLGGARRRITVFFADVRGFTEMTDSGQARAELYVREHNLSAEQAEAYHDQHAKEMLATVNNYLATIADQIKEHGGTLDKYIGDCVMAFWGAPIANERHATDCVHAAIEAQRAIHALNQQRFVENKRRELENTARAGAGQPPLPLLPLLTLGTGINTGTAVVGLMGSEEHTFNYTVFGREVNIASRLESVSGRGRIFISDATFLELQRDDPALAAKCVPQAPQTLKGIQGTVKIFEVPWKPEAAPTPPAAATPTA